MQFTDKASIPESVMARRVGEETVILDLASGTYFGLDPIGARIWQLMTEGRTLAQICDAIQTEYEVGRPAAEQDLLALAGDLQAHGLIAPAATS